MPTPDWRYEKSSSAVKALCRVLLTELGENQRADIQIALHDSLKLLCDAITAECLVPETGIEPATFALRVRCSTD